MNQNEQSNKYYTYVLTVVRTSKFLAYSRRCVAFMSTSRPWDTRHPECFCPAFFHYRFPKIIDFYFQKSCKVSSRLFAKCFMSRAISVRKTFCCPLLIVYTHNAYNSIYMYVSKQKPQLVPSDASFLKHHVTPHILTPSVGALQ